MRTIKLAATAAVTLAALSLAACSGAEEAPTSQTCQDWSVEYGLTDQAVVIACQVGENAEGEMTEAEYQERLDDSLNTVKGWIDETGGL